MSQWAGTPDGPSRRAAERAAAAAAVCDGAAPCSRIALHEDAARTCRTELESRTGPDALPELPEMLCQSYFIFFVLWELASAVYAPR